MLGADPTLTTAENYRRFAEEVAGKSPLYHELCERVAGDRDMLRFLAAQPPAKRQPNLLLGAVRVLFGLQFNYEAFRTAVLAHREQIEAVLRLRRTQTNEPGRCAALLPVLATLPQPLALLEVGAAGGLCLLPDRYGYDYAGAHLGSDEVVFECTPYGPVPVPRELPEIAWRAGIDLRPIDLDDSEAVRWLEALVWPEEEDRLSRLRQAIAVARRDPPTVVEGDLLDRLHDLATSAPEDATLVVFHTAVLAYLNREERADFRRQVSSLPATWISNEAPGVASEEERPTTPPVADSHFVIARDGQLVARCDPHGRWIQWV